MKHVDRWMEGEATELERALFTAVAGERPTRALRRRMQQGLGLAGSLVTLKAAAAVVGSAVVIAAVVGVVFHQRSTPEPAPMSAQLAPIASSKAPDTVLEPSSGPLLSPATSSEDKSVASAERVKAAHSRAPAEETQTLRDEVRILERARSALRDGAPQRTLAELDAYGERFPRGVLGQEATVLRIEALERSGQGARARTLARDFIGKHPKSPHIERLNRLLFGVP